MNLTAMLFYILCNCNELTLFESFVNVTIKCKIMMNMSGFHCQSLYLSHRFACAYKSSSTLISVKLIIETEM